MSTSPPYLSALMRVSRSTGRRQVEAREALALAITEHNHRLLTVGAQRVP